MRRKSYTKNGVRIVRFPGGRVAKFHKPGTKAFAQGAARKRAAGKRLAKLYGFAKKRRSTRRTVKSNPRRSNRKTYDPVSRKMVRVKPIRALMGGTTVAFTEYWSGHGDPKWEIRQDGVRQAAGFSTEKAARVWWKENKNLRSNPRVSKTELLHVVQGNYGQGWEDIAASPSWTEARNDIRAYRDNEGGNYRLIQRRVKKETNPRRKTKARRNPSDAFNVYLGRKLIDTVFATKGSYTAAEMKRSLVNHDGYDSRITVKKARK